MAKVMKWRELQQQQRRRERKNGYRELESDPTLSTVVKIIKSSGMTPREIEVNSGVTQQTIYRWMSGRVKFPKSLTMDAVLSVCGWDRVIVRRGRND